MKMDDLPARPLPTQRALTIHLSSSTGEGPTPLAAFDAALWHASVANYNLLCLSSVIPPNARIVRAWHRAQPDDHGRRLYVVKASRRPSQPGQHEHAGIGWVQQGDDGPGPFVELHDDDPDRLEPDLYASLNAMRRSRELVFGPVQTALASRLCTAKPVSAPVVAVFACEPW